MTALLDFIDARRRLIQERFKADWSVDDLAEHFALDVESIEAELRISTEPPTPGSARAQAEGWRARATALEAELLKDMPMTIAPAPRALLSDVRELTPGEREDDDDEQPA